MRDADLLRPRADTEYDITPKIPTAASTSATTAKIDSSIAAMRCWNDDCAIGLLERLDRVDRLLGIERADCGPHRRQQRRGAAVAADEHEQLVPGRLLPHRHEDLRPDRPASAPPFR